MFTALLYGLTALVAIWSYRRDRRRTRQAFAKAWKAFDNILPEFLGVIVLVGIAMALLRPAVIAAALGENSGWVGVVLAACVGAVTLIPGFIAFPLAAMVLRGGAGLPQIGAFLSSLMMVGVITAPVEVRYFGKRATALRNASAFLFSFLVAWVIGKVV